MLKRGDYVRLNGGSPFRIYRTWETPSGEAKAAAILVGGGMTIQARVDMFQPMPYAGPDMWMPLAG